ncbi:TPA: hypothetical protein ACX6R1_000975 [Photobacterium damselae]
MGPAFNCVILVVSSLLILGCGVPLSKEAQKIMTINDGALIAMMGCQELGFVTGQAGMWNGMTGLYMAYSDAKNQAAKLREAEVILILNSQMNPISIVNAKVYNCSEEQVKRVKMSKPHLLDGSIEIAREKALKCHNKGGVWFEGQCVISVD